MTVSRKRIINLILAYLITFAVFNLGGFASTDILLGVIYIAVYAILCRLTGVSSRVLSDAAWSDRRIVRASYILSAIWTFLYCIYAADRLGGGMENRLFAAVYTVCTVAGIYILICFSIRYVIVFVQTHISGEAVGCDGNGFVADSTDADADMTGFSIGRFFIYAGIIFICLLPMFLMNYPGTMTVDSFDQLNQARGLYPYSDLHPWAHTLIIQLFWHIGYAVTGSVNGGIACYTIVQMIIMSLSVAYAIESLSEAGLTRMGRIAILLGYLLYPYNPAYAITMWKDVIFSAGVLVFTITLYRVARSYRWTSRDITVFIISSIAVCLIRHNGFYAFIVTMIVFIVYLVRTGRHESVSGSGQGGNPYARKRLILTGAMLLTIIIATCIFNGPIHDAYGVEPVEYAHNLAVPLQQVARVVSHNGTISASDMEMIERINTPEYLRTHYEPGGADPAMQWVIYGDMAYLEKHKPEYLGLWIRLGLNNPRAYIEAYIDQTRGYYTTMPPEQTEYYGILPNSDGLENTPVILTTKRIKINEISYKLHDVLPVYAILYSPGACLQLLMLGVALIIICRKSRSGYVLIAYIPVTALILTVLIATPLCADLRYAYPLMLCMPSLIAITYIRLRNA